jgi:hypothetical protein
MQSSASIRDSKLCEHGTSDFLLPVQIQADSPYNQMKLQSLQVSAPHHLFCRELQGRVQHVGKLHTSWTKVWPNKREGNFHLHLMGWGGMLSSSSLCWDVQTQTGENNTRLITLEKLTGCWNQQTSQRNVVEQKAQL